MSWARMLAVPQPVLPPLPPLVTQRRLSVGVIGAGVVGLSSALWLQRAGHRVTLVDPAAPTSNRGYAQAASFGNACTMAFGACIPVATPGVLRAVPRMLLDRQGPLTISWRDLPGLVPWQVPPVVTVSLPVPNSWPVAVSPATFRRKVSGELKVCSDVHVDPFARLWTKVT